MDWLLTELYNKRKQTVRSINECTWLYEKFFLFVDGYLSSDGKNCMATRMVEMFSSVSSETTNDKEPCDKVQFDTCESAVDARNLETRASSAAYRRGMVGQFSILSDTLSSG